MLATPNSNPSPTADDRHARVEALRQRLQPLVEQTAQTLAEELVDVPDEQLFGTIEFTLREHSHRLAAAAHQAGLDSRQKKTATTVPVSSATSAATTPSSSITSSARSSP